MQSMSSAVPSEWATRTLIGRVLPLWRDAVDVFCSSSRLGHLGRVLPLWRDAVDVFCSSIRVGHQDTHWESLTPLKRCSRCLLQLQPTGPPGHSLGGSYPSVEMHSVSSAVPSEWATRTLIGRVFPLCRDAVGVFCSSIRLGHQDTHWESLTPL